MPHCMVPGCTNGSKKTKGKEISYHRLPKDAKLKKIWMSKTSRLNPAKENSCYVCSSHFTQDCFEVSYKHLCGQKGKKVLKHGSIPTIFPHKRQKSERYRTVQRLRNRDKTEEVEWLLNSDTEEVAQVDIQNSMEVNYKEEKVIELNTKVDAITQCAKTLTRSIGTQTLKTQSCCHERKKEKSQYPNTEQINLSDYKNHLSDHTYSKYKPINGSDSKPSESITVENKPQCTDMENSCEDSDDKETESSIEDSDDDYTYTNTDDSSEAESEDINNCKTDLKFIVYDSKIDELLRMCQQCGSPVCEVKKTYVGSMTVITTLCLQNHSNRWNSQPTTANSIPVGNIQIPSAIVCSGGTYQGLASFASALKLKFISEANFYKIQNNTILPAIDKVYKKQQLPLIDELKKKGSVNLCGDGRSDSPGYSAKYGTYSLMDEDTNKIVDFSLIHVSEVSSSSAMEYEGCKRSLDKLLSLKVPIRSLTTDRHIQITANLRKSYPKIIHQYDVWHVSKSVTKKLTQKAKIKGNEELSPWIKSIVNHLWWCAQTCDKDPKVLVSNWVSIVNHVANKHCWKEGKVLKSCKHHKLTKREQKNIRWIKPGSPAHVALEDIVCNKKLLKDIEKLSEFHHTGNLEVYHSHLLRYLPKRSHFSYQGMVGRTQLTIIDHNNNCERKQATVKKGTGIGESRYKVVFPKNRKTWVAKPILEKKSYDFVTNLMDVVMETHETRENTAIRVPENIPKNIASVKRPPKDDVIKQHISRMGKKVKKKESLLEECDNSKQIGNTKRKKK